MIKIPFIAILLFLLAMVCCKKDNSTAPASTSNAGTITNVSPNDFLSATIYDRLVIQVQYVNGLQPSEGSINNLKSLLQQRLNKPGNVEISYSNINSPGKVVYTIEDIRAIEALNRTVKHEGKTITAYILFIDGDYSQNSGNLKTLGVAYGSSSMVVFEKTIRDLSGGLGQPSVGSVETTVTNHEFGHILGLVNNGSSMVAGHQDEPHGRHCNNTNCLMYYATETSDIVNNLIGNNIPSLDANCINDLKANGGK